MPSIGDRSEEPDDEENLIERVVVATNLIQSESMDIDNDPRFFQDNVIDKRLAAFSSLSVVSGLMVGTCMDQIFGMKKDFLFDFDGFLQLLSFALISFSLFVNMIAVYVGVAQIYHTFRLVSAGPTGFEMASAYYLNRNVAFWRHFAIKSMLFSLPCFLLSVGMRLQVKVDLDSPDPAAKPNRSIVDARIFGVTVLGLIMFIFWSIAGLVLFYINRQHQITFTRCYENNRVWTKPLISKVASMSNRGQHHPLDM